MPANTADHVQAEDDVPAQADKIASLVREMINREVKVGRLDPTLLQEAIENGGILQDRILPVIINAGSIGRLVVSALLEPVTTISTLAVKSFGDKAEFSRENTDGVQIYAVGPNFKTNFGGKKESSVPAATLRAHKLRKGSVDGPIIEELGGQQLVETPLATMWEAMKRQGQGQVGDLLVNGYANIFYVRADDDVLWAVYCRWSSDYGWDVYVYSVSRPGEWSAGCQVVSR
jgi:hypothetical protein